MSWLKLEYKDFLPEICDTKGSNVKPRSLLITKRATAPLILHLFCTEVILVGLLY